MDIAMKILINRQWCKGCGICVAFCRPGALELNSRDVESKAVWDAEKCIHCGLCELYCPDLAIEHVDDEPDARQVETEQSAAREEARV